MNNIYSKEFMDLFDADLCAIALGRKQRDEVQISEVDELLDPTDDLIKIINELI